MGECQLGGLSSRCSVAIAACSTLCGLDLPEAPSAPQLQPGHRCWENTGSGCLGLAENGCEKQKRGEKMCPQMRVLGVQDFSFVFDFSQMTGFIIHRENEN